MKHTGKVLMTTIMACSVCFSFSQTSDSGNGGNSKQDITGSGPRIIGAGTISTGLNERDIAISADGKEYYYTLLAPKNLFSSIVVRKFVNEKWSEPEVAVFSGVYSDLEAAFSPDGKKLFFSSNRPLDGKGPAKDYDIWYVEKTAAGWSEPKNIGSNVNTKEDEFYPSLTKDGTLYFTAAYAANQSKDDIFRSKLANGEYQKPERLSEPVNSKGYEFNAYIAPEEKYIIYTCYGRKDDMGRGDLYISYRKADDTWEEPKNLGSAINSKSLDYCPLVSPDKKYLYFTSERIIEKQSTNNYESVMDRINGAGNGMGDIYRIELSKALSR